MRKKNSNNENNTHGYFTGSEATIEDLKDIGVNVKDDIKYYAALSGGSHEIMEILHNIHKKWTCIEKNIGTIDCFE